MVRTSKAVEAIGLQEDLRPRALSVSLSPSRSHFQGLEETIAGMAWAAIFVATQLDFLGPYKPSQVLPRGLSIPNMLHHCKGASQPD